MSNKTAVLANSQAPMLFSFLPGCYCSCVHNCKLFHFILWITFSRGLLTVIGPTVNFIKKCHWDSEFKNSCRNSSWMPFKRDRWEWGLQLISNIFRAIDYFDAVAVNGTHCGKNQFLLIRPIMTLLEYFTMINYYLYNFCRAW